MIKLHILCILKFLLWLRANFQIKICWIGIHRSKAPTTKGMNESLPSPAILLMNEGGGGTQQDLGAAAADDYEYDVSESLDHYNWAELIPVVIVYSVVLLLGVLGNGKNWLRSLY